MIVSQRLSFGMPVVLSGYSGVNTGGSLWVLRCQYRWFSLGTPVTIPVVLSGYSGVNTGGSLWVLWCLKPSNAYSHDIVTILLEVTSTTHTSLFYLSIFLPTLQFSVVLVVQPGQQ